MNEGVTSRQLLRGLCFQRNDGRRGPSGLWISLMLVLVIATMSVAYPVYARAVAVPATTAPARSVSVNTAPVQATPIISVSAKVVPLQATGYVVAQRQATVSAQITDTLIAVDVREGDHVKKGQVLAQLDPAEYQAQLDIAQAQYAAAQAKVIQVGASLNSASYDDARMGLVVSKGVVSKRQAEQASVLVVADRAGLNVASEQAEAAKDLVQAAQIAYNFSIVRAPFAGVVTDKVAQVGEVVSPLSAGNSFTRAGVATITDMNSLEVEADVDEDSISRVLPGMRVTAVLDAYPSWKIPAHVIEIGPVANRATGTVEVNIALDRKDPRILPEMKVRVLFPETG